MISEYRKMLEEVENLERSIEHFKSASIDLIENMLVYVHGVDHPLNVAVHERSHGARDEEALSELRAVHISAMEARKKFFEVQVKYTERGLKLMNDQSALDDDDLDVIKQLKSRE
jgi:hypothetical protein